VEHATQEEEEEEYNGRESLRLEKLHISFRK